MLNRHLDPLRPFDPRGRMPAMRDDVQSYYKLVTVMVPGRGYRRQRPTATDSEKLTDRLPLIA